MLKSRFYQRWDGCSKSFTENCESCEGYLPIQEFEICGWGAAFKYLSKKKKIRKCSSRNKAPINRETMAYLEDLIKNPEKYKIPINTQLKLEFK